MWYMGGKFRQSKQILQTLLSLGLNKDSIYIEPFCGAMWSATKIIENVNPKDVILSDVSEYLILFWKHIIETRDVPPAIITEEEYNKYRKEKPKQWLTAWYGFGVSFGGGWFAGLARQKDKKYDKYDFTPQVRSTMHKVDILKKSLNLSVFCANYRLYDNYTGMYFYLDPPYENRTKAHDFDSFDYDEFWDFARTISKNNVVIITCYDCPKDFKTLYNFGDTVVRHHSGKGKDGTNEKIVRYNG